ncbi:MAG: hypothetical protein J2P13_09270, partial [Acidobacteria bacterium]|nr:hypothetical protein [Acidobacteriota bacterium]
MDRKTGAAPVTSGTMANDRVVQAGNPNRSRSAVDSAGNSSTVRGSELDVDWEVRRGRPAFLPL